MANSGTHSRIAANNEQTMKRLLNPHITGGIASTNDHPWIAVMAYYTVYHLVAEVSAIVAPDNPALSHDEQVEFLQKTPKLKGVVGLYNNLNTLRKYALYRPPVNVSFETERKILHYADAKHFQKVVLDDWFGTLKNTIAAYRKSLLSVK